jgi:hypothetical protein
VERHERDTEPGDDSPFNGLGMVEFHGDAKPDIRPLKRSLRHLPRSRTILAAE